MVQMVLCIKNVPPPGTYVRTKPKCLHTHLVQCKWTDGGERMKE